MRRPDSDPLPGARFLAALVGEPQANSPSTEAIQKQFGKENLPLVQSLLKEPNTELFLQGLWKLGLLLESQDRLASAGHIYSAIAQASDSPLGKCASRRLEALQGTGGGSSRLEILQQRFLQDAADPAALLTMGIAGAAFRVTRLGVMSRLRCLPSAGLLSRGLGLRAASAGAGFLAETVSFTTVGRALRESNPAAPDFPREWASGALMLGALKVMGGASGLVQGSRIRSGLFPKVLPQIGMFGGILLGNQLQVALGLKAPQQGATAFFDAAATLLQFNVAGHLAKGVLGPDFANWENKMEFWTRESKQNHGPHSKPLFGLSEIPSGSQFENLSSPENHAMTLLPPRRPQGFMTLGSGGGTPSSETVRQYQRGWRLLNQAWHQLRAFKEDYVRNEGIGDLAMVLAQLGLKEDARSLITEILRSTEKMENEVDRAQAQGSLITKLGNLGVVLNDSALVIEASRLAEKIGWAVDRSKTEGKIAVILARMGLREEARSLVDKAYLSATLIEFSLVRAQGEDQVAENLAELGLLWREPALVVEAGQWADNIKKYAETASFSGSKFEDGYRADGQQRVAAKLAELGVILKDPALIIEAMQWAAKIEEGYCRSRAQSKIAVRFGELGLRQEARSLFLEASKSASKAWESENRQVGKHQVAVQLAELGLILKDPALIIEASRWVVKIGAGDALSPTKSKITLKLGDLGVALKDPALIQKAFRWAQKFSNVYENSRVRGEVAVKLAELGVALKKTQLIFRASQWARKIEQTNYRFEAQKEIALKLAELGNMDKARSLILEVARSEEVRDASGGSWAQREIAITLWQLGLTDKAWSMIKEATRLAIKTSDSQAQADIAMKRAWLGVAMIQRAQSDRIPRRSALGDENRPGNTLDLLGRVLTTTSAKEERDLRREAMKQLAGVKDPRDFRILTTALQACEDGPSTQRLIEMVRDWKDLDNPLFPQLLSRLIKTKNLKALSLATGFLGQKSFQPRHSDRPWQYRLWLLKKLEESGYLETGLSDYLKGNESTSRRGILDIWIQGVVGQLGLTPSVPLMKALLETSWTDQKGKKLTTPQAVISYLVSRREAYRSNPDYQKLLSDLSINPQESFFYYLLFGGRTQFALINKYALVQFQGMLRRASELGPVHEVVMEKWEEALKAGDLPGKLRRRAMSRLRKGQWPLAGDVYARALRIDVSSEKQWEGLRERLNAAFSHDQLGLMIEAAISRRILGEIEEASGLNELAGWLARLKERTPDLPKEIQEKVSLLQQKLPKEILDIIAFRTQVEKDWRQALKNKKKEVPHDAPTEEVAARYVESLLETDGQGVALPHREEWKSHLKEIFEGLGRLGGRGSEEKERMVTLRYLDKSKNLVEFLRFADAAQCCFTSEHDSAQDWIARIWKDPLSFVFLIEDNLPDVKTRHAIGFVFGSFGIKDGKPAVLLNGVYLQGKTNEATLAVLHAIEEDFSRPLGAAHQLVAATHGGATHLDAAELNATGGSAAYTNRPAQVTRLRALTFRGMIESKIYDDIGVGINQEAETGGHVWVKKL